MFRKATTLYVNSNRRKFSPAAMAVNAVLLTGVLGISAFAQVGQDPKQPVIVQPGAPGEPTKTLPDSTTAKLPPHTKQDVAFMQGMIMHHGQAVEMTALINDRTENSAIRLLGAKISQAQGDEMNFMRRWLVLRGESVEMEMPKAGPNTDPHSHGNHTAQPAAATHTMPGMLTVEQMAALAKAKGTDFDRLFLKGMIMHHEGALTMVKELFGSPGAGQDAEIFNFASDVDTGQRAEIETMRSLLGEKP